MCPPQKEKKTQNRIKTRTLLRRFLRRKLAFGANNLVGSYNNRTEICETQISKIYLARQKNVDILTVDQKYTLSGPIELSHYPTTLKSHDDSQSS